MRVQTSHWMLATVAYVKTGDDGKLVKVKDTYCVETASFTECEALVTKAAHAGNLQDFDVITEKRAAFHDIAAPDQPAAKWFLVKTDIITVSDNGKQQVIKYPFLVGADNINHARTLAVQSIGDTIYDYEIRSITETKIVGVIATSQSTTI